MHGTKIGPSSANLFVCYVEQQISGAAMHGTKMDPSYANLFVCYVEQQISGVAMGTKMGPSSANLFVCYVEQKFFKQYTEPTPDFFGGSLMTA